MWSNVGVFCAQANVNLEKRANISERLLVYLTVILSRTFAQRDVNSNGPEDVDAVAVTRNKLLHPGIICFVF